MTWWLICGGVKGRGDKVHLVVIAVVLVVAVSLFCCTSTGVPTHYKFSSTHHVESEKHENISVFLLLTLSLSLT
jgi:hypothetical protein